MRSFVIFCPCSLPFSLSPLLCFLPSLYRVKSACARQEEDHQQYGSHVRWKEGTGGHLDAHVLVCFVQVAKCEASSDPVSKESRRYLKMQLYLQVWPTLMHTQGAEGKRERERGTCVLPSSALIFGPNIWKGIKWAVSTMNQYHLPFEVVYFRNSVWNIIKLNPFKIHVGYGTIYIQTAAMLLFWSLSYYPFWI